MQGLHRDLACSLVTVSPRPCREPLLGEHKSVCSMQVGTELAARFGCCFLSTIQTAWLCVPQRKAGLRHCIPRWDFPLQGPFHLKTPTKAQPVSLARPAAAGAWGPRLFSPRTEKIGPFLSLFLHQQRPCSWPHASPLVPGERLGLPPPRAPAPYLARVIPKCMGGSSWSLGETEDEAGVGGVLATP